MDCDGHVDFDDIDAFILGLNSPEAYEALFGVPSSFKGDTDGDGDLDFDDVSGFVGVLRAPSISEAHAVPEPTSMLAVGIAVFVAFVDGTFWRRFIEVSCARETFRASYS